MRDIRWLTPALCRALPSSIHALPGRAFGSLVLAFCLLTGLSATAAAQTYTLTVSPTTSTDGSYTVS